jgi:hypothetical protein
MISDEQIEAWCEVMHDAYEKAAVEAGWETQERSRVPWADVPEENKQTMRAAVRALVPHLLENSWYEGYEAGWEDGEDNGYAETVNPYRNG